MKLSPNDVHALANNLSDKFIELYNEKYPCAYLEDKNIIGQGYCLYFAHLLKTLVPEGDVINTNISTLDYIFKYQDSYFNYAGIIGREFDCIYIGYNYKIEISQMSVVDVDYELSISDILGFDQVKEAIWYSFLPTLLEAGNSFIQELYPGGTLKKKL